TIDTGQHSAFYPRWSPDGRRITFVSNEEGRWNINTCNLDGAGRVNYTASLKGAHGMDGPIDWSPDASKIVFHADTNPYEAGIFVIDTVSGMVSRVTMDEWFNEAPSWTSDGKGII